MQVEQAMRALVLATAFALSCVVSVAPVSAQSGGSQRKPIADKKQAGGQQVRCRDLSRQQIAGGNMRAGVRAQHEESLRQQGLCR